MSRRRSSRSKRDMWQPEQPSSQTVAIRGLVTAHAPRRRPSSTAGRAGVSCCRARQRGPSRSCLLYTSDAADEEDSVDLGGRRIIKKKKNKNKKKRNTNQK